MMHKSVLWFTTSVELRVHGSSTSAKPIVSLSKPIVCMFECMYVYSLVPGVSFDILYKPDAP